MTDVLRRWRPEDGDTRCQHCSYEYQPWFTDNSLWNEVMGGSDCDGDPGGFLCPRCFTEAAEWVHPGLMWRVIPQWNRRAELMDWPASEITATVRLKRRRLPSLKNAVAPRTFGWSPFGKHRDKVPWGQRRSGDSSPRQRGNGDRGEGLPTSADLPRGTFGKRWAALGPLNQPRFPSAKGRAQ